jgi:hypothetical protein
MDVVHEEQKIFDRYFLYWLIFLTMLHIILIAPSTETNKSFKQLLFHLPEDIGNKIYFMWYDLIDYSDNQAAQNFYYQHQNDIERENDWH